MAKVKKWTGLTGERNKKGGAEGRGTKQAPKGEKRAESKPVKRAEKTIRKTAAKKTKSTRKPVTARGAGAKRAGAKRMKASKSKKRMVLVRGRQAVVAPTIRVAVKSLDPMRKCGPNTTVELLYRVDETVDGRSTPHLVFFDRHGWYCEHGRTCPAVGHAKKYNGQIARVS